MDAIITDNIVRVWFFFAFEFINMFCKWFKLTVILLIAKDFIIPDFICRCSVQTTLCYATNVAHALSLNGKKEKQSQNILPRVHMLFLSAVKRGHRLINSMSHIAHALSLNSKKGTQSAHLFCHMLLCPPTERHRWLQYIKYIYMYYCSHVVI